MLTFERTMEVLAATTAEYAREYGTQNAEGLYVIREFLRDHELSFRIAIERRNLNHFREL